MKLAPFYLGADVQRSKVRCTPSPLWVDYPADGRVPTRFRMLYPSRRLDYEAEF